MRELQGVIYASLSFPERRLKHQALLFDKIQVIALKDFLEGNWRADAKAFYADLKFLRSRKFISHVSDRRAHR